MAQVATAAASSPPNGFAPPASSHYGKPLDYAVHAQALKGADLADPDSYRPRAHTSRRSRSKRPDSLLGSLRLWLLEHQIGVSLNLLITLALSHLLLPRARAYTRPFFQLSYHDPATGMYRRGPDDFYFVCYWVVIFTALRAACMSWLLYPFADLAGIRKRKTKTRFAEQAWLLIYYSISFGLGMYVMYNSNYWLRLNALWEDFPVLNLSGTFKWYYLVQFAFWVQQIAVVNIEERRKDHWQMFTHHIVTCLLLLFSYGYYMTKVGNVVLCLMDVVDIVFPAAKMLKYAGCQTLCDAMFGVFMVLWLIARHILYLIVCWSVHSDLHRIMVYGCYSRDSGAYLHRVPAYSDLPGGDGIVSELLGAYTHPKSDICYNDNIRVAFLSLLLFLQGITIMWFTMIVRMAWRVIKGQGADDSRSDSEGDDEEEEEVELAAVEVQAASSAAEQTASAPAQPLEEYVGVDGLSFTRKSGANVRSRKPGTSAGLATVSDKKDLLGRIGCDKPA